MPNPAWMTRNLKLHSQWAYEKSKYYYSAAGIEQLKQPRQHSATPIHPYISVPIRCHCRILTHAVSDN